MKKSLFMAAVTLALPFASHASSQLDAQGLAGVLNSSEVQAKLGNQTIQSVKVTSESGKSGKGVSHTITLTTSEAGLGPKGPSSHPCILEVRLEEIFTVQGIDRVIMVGDQVCAANSIPRR